MKNFRVGAAIWDTGPALYIRAGDLPSFEERGIGVAGGKPIAVSFTHTWLQMLLRAAEAGETASTFRPCDYSEQMAGWDYRVTFETKSYPCRCHVHETTAAWNHDGLSVDLGPSYQLPWPKIQFYEEAEKDELVRRDIRARMESARTWTGNPCITIDPRFLARLKPAERVSLFTKGVLP